MAIPAPRVTSRRPQPQTVAGLAAAGVAGIAALGLTKLSGAETGAIAAVAVVVGGLLLSSPRAAVAVFLAVLILFEAAPDWGVSWVSKPYTIEVKPLSLFELVELLALAAVLLDAVRRRRVPRLPEALLVPLGLATAGLVWGVVVGHGASGDFRNALISVLQTYLPLWIVPFLVVNVVETREDLRRWAEVGMALAALKGLLGMGVVLSGLAPAADGNPALSYYEPAANLLTLAFVLLGITCLLTRRSLPRWAWWGILLAVGSLVLSYRRSFWLGFAFVLPLLIVVASGRTGRRLLVPALVVVGLLGFTVVQAGLLNGVSGDVVDRVSSISPTKVTRNNQDRYRLAERRNVLLEVRRQPWTGLGVGVNWRATKPLNIDRGGTSRQYVHTAVLWHWMKFGPLGVLAYLSLLGAAVAAGIRGWRVASDGVVGAACLAVAATTVALAIVEISASFIGPDERGTAMFALLLGFVCAVLLVERTPRTP